MSTAGKRYQRVTCPECGALCTISDCGIRPHGHDGKMCAGSGRRILTRKSIINQARNNLDEITQYFIDVSHWNDTRGKTEGIINPDPDGSMHRLREALSEMISSEPTIAKT